MMDSSRAGGNAGEKPQFGHFAISSGTTVKHLRHVSVGLPLPLGSFASPSA